MRHLARRLFLILCTVALIGGSAVSLAASVTSVGPCVHEHGSHDDSAPMHHDRHDAGCLACCLGACSATPGLPPMTAVAMAEVIAGTVTWWETSHSGAGRSITPDSAPPRTST